MDLYSLTRERRPSHPTVAFPTTNSSLPPNPTSNILSSDPPQESTPPLKSKSTYDSHQPPDFQDSLQPSAVWGAKSPSISSFNDSNQGPSRKHWKPDSQASKCMAQDCSRSFGIFLRKHHCRKCGDIFCYYHASNFVPLDETCEFNTAGQRSRVCNGCFEKHCASFLPKDVTMLRQNPFLHHSTDVPSRISQSSLCHGDNSFGQSTSFGTGFQSPNSLRSVSTQGIHIMDSQGTGAHHETQGNEEPPPSVPSNWNWSTF